MDKNGNTEQDVSPKRSDGRQKIIARYEHLSYGKKFQQHTLYVLTENSGNDKEQRATGQLNLVGISSR